ncbi:SAM-dependent methyltransferase [Shewanella cyperi]|uniref:SAM-dependent methyltransferase n=1 Tax=Shewanella cyperi TaxID=2814292 RepID=UPI003969F9D2
MQVIKNGSLVCVGTGLKLAGQVSVIARSYLEHADVVFSLMPDGFHQRWVEGLNPNVVNLQQFYGRNGEIKNRRITYRQMVAAMLEQVRNGKKVVGAFYGHPGVFACVPHMAIQQAREEGFEALMEPGISAEACLWADLGIDPGTSGHQSFEASQFMFFRHVPDPSCHLLLWQIALAGEHTLTQFNTSSDRLQALVEQLQEWYCPEHEVIIYEAANLPVQAPRITRVPLSQLPWVTLTPASTLLIPPARKLEYNMEVLQRLGLTPGDLA